MRPETESALILGFGYPDQVLEKKCRDHVQNTVHGPDNECRFGSKV